MLRFQIIISKYYIRMYTINGNFYKTMKKSLLEKDNDKNSIYLPYIKTLYAGLDEGALKTYDEGHYLYSFQILSNEQIDELNELNEKQKKENKREDLPMAILFSKSFLSFSKDVNEVKRFHKEDKINVMLIIQNSKEEFNLHTHADIEKLSFYRNEKEVLFFPFSAFGIKDFKKKSEKEYELKLDYLGKYIEKFKTDNKFENQNAPLPDNNFKILYKNVYY